MVNCSEYNLISIGDHCAVPIILKELNLRKCAYPFDWNSNTDLLYKTNIITNLLFIDELYNSENIDDIVKRYIGDALENEYINKNNNITFQHESGTKTEIFDKYKRRFNRLKTDLNKKNIFIILTRKYFITSEVFEKIKEQLLSYNNESIILFISGTNNDKKVIFKHINYDVSQFYQYDYTHFRPNIKKFLYEFLG